MGSPHGPIHGEPARVRPSLSRFTANWPAVAMNRRVRGDLVSVHGKPRWVHRSRAAAPGGERGGLRFFGDYSTRMTWRSLKDTVQPCSSSHGTRMKLGNRSIP